MHLSDTDFNRFSQLVAAQTGLHVAQARRPDLEAAVVGTMHSLGLPNSDALFTLLADTAHGAAARHAMVKRLAIGETHFFRNRPQFAALEGAILPALIAQRQPQRRLRLWSAGCASGEEPYSLAMLLRQLLPDLAQWDILILATDINQEALRQAAAGLYSSWSFREAPEEVQRLYFEPQGRRWQLQHTIRDMVTLRPMNLAAESDWAGMCNFDLILCRNVMIYFAEGTTRLVIERFYQSLAPGGWLLVGHSEPNQSYYQAFHTHNFPGAVVYRKPNAGDQPLAAALEPSASSRSSANRHSAHQPFARQSWSVTPTHAAPHHSPAPDQADHAATLPGVDTTRTAGPTLAHLPHSEHQAIASGNLPSAGAQRISGKPQEPPAATPGNDRTTAFELAKRYASHAQYDLAASWLQLALRQAPLSAPMHYLHGLILQEQGNLDEALAALRRCIYADPEFVLGRIALAGLCTRLGQNGRAAKELDAVARWAAERSSVEMVPEGDGLTVGRLRDLAATQTEILCRSITAQ